MKNDGPYRTPTDSQEFSIHPDLKADWHAYCEAFRMGIKSSKSLQSRPAECPKCGQHGQTHSFSYHKADQEFKSPRELATYAARPARMVVCLSQPAGEYKERIHFVIEYAAKPHSHEHILVTCDKCGYEIGVFAPLVREETPI